MCVCPCAEASAGTLSLRRAARALFSAVARRGPSACFLPPTRDRGTLTHRVKTAALNREAVLTLTASVMRMRAYMREDEN